MSRTKYSVKQPWKWPGWALNLFVTKPFRRKCRMQERQATRGGDLEAMIWTKRPKLPYWD